MATKVRVKRDNKGRYAGSYGGGGGNLVRPSASKSRLARQSAPVARRPARTVAKGAQPQGKRRQLTSGQKKALAAGIAVGVGVGGHYAFRKALPRTNFSKSPKQIAGMQTLAHPEGLVKGTRISRVDDGGLTFLTQSVPSGRGVKRKIETSTLVQKGNTTIGIVHSERYSRVSRTNIVKSTYLTPANRQKGIGSRALIAHAAHDPKRLHRASITRSVQGQAFARSNAKAGLRSTSSKKKGDQLTREMNSMWKVNKTDYTNVAKELKAATTGSRTTKLDVNAAKRAKRRIR